MSSPSLSIPHMTNRFVRCSNLLFLLMYVGLISDYARFSATNAALKRLCDEERA